MTAIWELRLYDPDGARVATFDQWADLIAQVNVNRPATYALRLNGSDTRVQLFDLDGILEGWWADPENGIAWRREFAAWAVDTDRWTDAGGLKNFISSGVGLEDLLARTIIDAYSGSAESEASGTGEEALREYVDEQAGLGAGTRARTGLSLEAVHSPALGSLWDGQRSNKNLLTVCQQIAEATGVQFGIERMGAYTFEFRVWEPMDRSDTVIFAEERGNMGEPRVTSRGSQVSNWVKIGGEGEADAREVAYVEDTTSIALSPQNRREIFLQAVDQSAGGQLESRGDQALAENRATSTFTFRPLQTPGCLYGKHYFLGDLVRALYDGATYIKRVDTVTFHVSAAGVQVQVGMIDANVESGS